MSDQEKSETTKKVSSNKSGTNISHTFVFSTTKVSNQNNKRQTLNNSKPQLRKELPKNNNQRSVINKSKTKGVPKSIPKKGGFSKVEIAKQIINQVKYLSKEDKSHNIKTRWNSLPLMTKLKIICIALIVIFLVLILFIVISVIFTMLTEEEEREYDNYNSIISTGPVDSNGTAIISVNNPKQINDVSVNITDCNGENIIATISLEDYLYGVVYAEIGATANTNGWNNIKSTTNNEQSKEMVKTQMVSAKTFALARGKYSEESGSIKIRSGSADQNWCDVYSGCIISDNSCGGFRSLREGENRPSDVQGKPALSEDSLKKYKEAYNEIKNNILLEENDNGETTFPPRFGYRQEVYYTNSIQNRMSELATEGKNYQEILKYLYYDYKICGETKDDGTLKFANNAICAVMKAERDPFALVTLANNYGITRDEEGNSINIPGTFVTLLTINQNGQDVLVNGYVSSCQGYRDFMNKETRVRDFHAGIDITYSGNVKVNSITGGTVTNTTEYENTGCGYSVTIQYIDSNSTQWTYRYCHMVKDSLQVKKGDEIKGAGVYLGDMGNTGNSTGKHLHLSISRKTSSSIVSLDTANLFANLYNNGTLTCGNKDIRKECDKLVKETDRKSCNDMFGLFKTYNLYENEEVLS